MQAAANNKNLPVREIFVLQLHPFAIFRAKEDAVGNAFQELLPELLHLGQILFPGFFQIHMMGNQHLAAAGGIFCSG